MRFGHKQSRLESRSKKHKAPTAKSVLKTEIAINTGLGFSREILSSSILIPSQKWFQLNPPRPLLFDALIALNPWLWSETRCLLGGGEGGGPMAIPSSPWGTGIVNRGNKSSSFTNGSKPSCLSFVLSLSSGGQKRSLFQQQHRVYTCTWLLNMFAQWSDCERCARWSVALSRHFISCHAGGHNPLVSASESLADRALRAKPTEWRHRADDVASGGFVGVSHLKLLTSALAFPPVSALCSYADLTQFVAPLCSVNCLNPRVDHWTGRSFP